MKPDGFPEITPEIAKTALRLEAQGATAGEIAYQAGVRKEWVHRLWTASSFRGVR
jgi:hypothetical protein